MTDRIDTYLDQLTEWRHDLHRHPELAFEEERTSGLVAERLESFGLEVHRGLGKTGVVATLKAGSSDRRLGLRADMDALPIHEQTKLGYQSMNDGKMHACGHDGHTTMLLGAARYLAETRNFDGTVYFIFQPAEEKDGGAREMIRDGLFEQFPTERVFGMHNFPGVPVGDFRLCAGPMMAAIDMVEAAVTGPGGHAAFPQGAVDTVVVAAELLLGWQTILSRNVDPLESAVLSITMLHAGEAANVIPDRVTLGGCVRTFLPEVQELIEARMQRLGEGIAAAHGAGFELDYRRYYPATVNSEDEVEMAAAAAAVVGNEVWSEMTPIMGSEDFSFMLQEKPGAFIMIGNGAKSAGLHTPIYDFNDGILGLGVRYWATLVERELAL